MKKLTEAGESAVPANAMGSSSSASGPVQTYDPILGKKVQKKGNKLSKDEVLEMLYKSRNII